MIKKIQFTKSIALLSICTQAQVLFTENFENYTLGNLGTDPTGVIPGQGGWFTSDVYSSTKANDLSLITNEPIKGKVLTLITNTTPTEMMRVTLVKPGVNTYFNQRATANNVIKLEVDYYTGEQHFTGQPPYYPESNQTFNVNYENNPVNQTPILFRLGFNSFTREAIVLYNQGDGYMLNLGRLKLPYDTWVTHTLYLDYNNRKIYFETPYNTSVFVGDFLTKSNSTNLLEDFKPSEFFIGFHAPGLSSIPLTNKYDNIKITALNAVPPHILSAESFLAEKFNMYPNPATNVVNITNGENLLVQQIAVYDSAGKLIITENYNNKTEIQLNVEHLASGTYLLHLKTAEGIAVKQLVKK